MKRLVLAAAALALAGSGIFGVGAARASVSGASVPMAASTTNDLLSRIPGLGGPDTRHICVIDDQLDFFYCVYIPLP